MPSRFELIAFTLTLTLVIIWLVNVSWQPPFIHRGVPLVGAAAIEQPSITRGAKAVDAGAR